MNAQINCLKIGHRTHEIKKIIDGKNDTNLVPDATNDAKITWPVVNKNKRSIPLLMNQINDQ
jgi:hypothetical protein